MKKKQKGAATAPLVTILLIIIIIIAIITISKKDNKDSKDDVNNEELFYAQDEILPQNKVDKEKTSVDEEKTNVELIDMTNTLNAEIVEGEKINTSSNISKDREIDGLKLTNITLKTENFASVFSADVKNESGKDFLGGSIRLIFKDNAGRKIADFEGWIPEIKNEESNTINAGTTTDVVNASDIIIELIK